MSKKTKPQNASVPKLPLTDRKPTTLVNTTNNVSTVIKAHPDYATHPEVQTSVTKWIAEALVIANVDQQMASLHTTLVALGQQRDTAITSWQRSTRGVIAAIDGVAAGSSQAIVEWGFDVATRIVQPAASDPPMNLRVGYTKTHVFVIRWKAIRAARAYLLQIGDGTPTGWGAIIQATKATYMPTGLASGQHIAIRVAAVRKNGQSAWSDVLSATFR